MALAIRRTSPAKGRLLATVMMTLALMLQPMYGVVAGQVANALTATVSNQAELEAAIADTGKNTISLSASFSVDKKISLYRSVTLNGNGNTLSSTRNNNPNDNDNNAVIGIDSATGVAINNLVVTRGAGRNLYGINAYQSTAVLSDVVITGFNNGGTKYGLLVGKDSNITVNNITTSGNSRGINVDKGTPKLTVNGRSNHSESTAIYVDSGNASYVVDTNSQYNRISVFGGWYSLKGKPTAPALVAPSQNATLDTNSVDISWKAVSGSSTSQAAATYNYRIDGGAAVNTAATNATVTLPNGAHSLEVQAVSLTGLESDWSTVRNFVVDADQLPVATIDAPAENGFVRTKAFGNKLSITGTYTDDRSVNYLSLQLVGNNGSIAYNLVQPGIGTLGGSFSHEMTVPADIADGEYTLIYTPSDYNPTTGGQFGAQQERHFTIDNTKPVVSLVAPTASVQGGTFSLQVDASDAGGLDKITANIYKVGQSGVYKSTTTSISGAQSGTHSASVSLPEGSYYIKYNASDRAGNISATGTFDFKVDTTGPTITIQPSSIGSNGRYSKIGFNFYDANKVDYVKINGQTTDLTNAVYSNLNDVAAHNWYGVTEGENTLVAYDVLGNSSSITFVVDRVKPTATFSFSNNNGNALTNQDVTVTMESSEPIQTPADWTYVDATHFTRVYSNNGKKDVVITDIAGNVSAPQKFEVKRIDKNAPTITGVTNGAVVKGSVALVVFDPKYEGYDGFDKLHGLKVNGVEAPTMEGPGKTYLYAASAEGSYTVVATDKAGNSTEVTFTIDNAAPVATLNMVDNPDGSVSVLGSISDANLSHYWLTITKDGVKLNLPNTNRYMYTAGLSDELLGTFSEDGEYAVKLEARDKAGNKDNNASVAELAFTISTDEESPEVETPPKETPAGGNTNTGGGNDGTGGESPVTGQSNTGGPSQLGIAAQLPFASIINGDSAGNEDAPSTDSDNGGEILGEQDKESGTPLEDTGEVAGVMDKKLFGLTWYWWVVLAAALVGGWLWLAAAIRRRREEEA